MTTYTCKTCMKEFTVPKSAGVLNKNHKHYGHEICTKPLEEVRTR